MRFYMNLKLHALLETIPSLSFLQLFLYHSQHLIKGSVEGVVHENLVRNCRYIIHEILFTSHKSWINHDPFLESLHDTNPGMVLYATMRSPYSVTLVGDPGAAPGAGAYIPPPNGLTVSVT